MCNLSHLYTCIIYDFSKTGSKCSSISTVRMNVPEYYTLECYSTLPLSISVSVFSALNILNQKFGLFITEYEAYHYALQKHQETLGTKLRKSTVSMVCEFNSIHLNLNTWVHNWSRQFNWCYFPKCKQSYLKPLPVWTKLYYNHSRNLYIVN